MRHTSKPVVHLDAFTDETYKRIDPIYFVGKFSFVDYVDEFGVPTSDMMTLIVEVR